MKTKEERNDLNVHGLYSFCRFLFGFGMLKRDVQLKGVIYG